MGRKWWSISTTIAIIAKEPQRNSCVSAGHISSCEKCERPFNAEFGCGSHLYSDGHNLKARAKCSGDSLKMVTSKFEASQTSPQTSEDAEDRTDSGLQWTADVRMEPRHLSSFPKWKNLKAERSRRQMEEAASIAAVLDAAHAPPAEASAEAPAGDVGSGMLEVGHHSSRTTGKGRRARRK
ncbi:hypothetical protein K402DRAFT_427735 [Aulographum hederae CBS 113979]|uniref:Uncharacterized protein n=1 Tax=Aulographum hederae CBS 113979 TaxID=1176131 RepID=A0A6G1H5K7_9PEZI|nr:hypothetical protein K402DRAFT_427735 [Aulographum hederae CBS 113979]